MTRVIHTGDTHVGYRQYHSPERREDFLAAFRRVIEDAVEEEVDAVVHAGDLFNDRRPDLQDLLGTISILEELRGADIPFLAVVGNHEDTRRGQWLDLFERLGLATHLDDAGTVIGDTTFYGLDYVPESKRDALSYDFEARDTANAALVSHGLFAPFPHGDWDLRSILEATDIDLDAVLLGDDHTPDTRKVADTWVTYCGSTERTSAAEREPRGYNIVEFDEEVSITRRGIETRDFVFIDAELGPSEGSSYIRERIREAAVADAVVVVTVEGEGESITPADIEVFGQEQGALITRVNDRRELEDEGEIEVSFADPDEVVRERVREMGLSEAARRVDGLVRDRDVAKSNVRGRVTDEIQELVDEPDAFEGVEPDIDSAPETSAETEIGPGPDRNAGDLSDVGDAGQIDTMEQSEAETGEMETPSTDRELAEAGDDEGEATAEEMETGGSAGIHSEDEDTSEQDDAAESEDTTTRETTMEDFL